MRRRPTPNVSLPLVLACLAVVGLPLASCSTPQTAGDEQTDRSGSADQTREVPSAAVACADGDPEACFDVADAYRDDPHIPDTLAVRTLTWLCRTSPSECRRVDDLLQSMDLDLEQTRKDVTMRGCEAGDVEACWRRVSFHQPDSDSLGVVERLRRQSSGNGGPYPAARARRLACRGGLEKACDALRERGQRSELVRDVFRLDDLSQEPVEGLAFLDSNRLVRWNEGGSRDDTTLRFTRAAGDGWTEPRRLLPESVTLDDVDIRTVGGELYATGSSRAGLFVWRPIADDPEPTEFVAESTDFCGLSLLDPTRDRALVFEKTGAWCHGKVRPAWWSLESGERVERTDPVEPPDRTAVASEAGLAAFVRDGGPVRLRRLGDFSETGTFGSFGDCKALQFGPDGRRLAVVDDSGGDNRTELWAVDGDQPRRLETWSEATDGIAFAPSGNRLAVAEDDRVRLVDPADGSRLAPPFEFEDDVDGWVAMAFSPDGNRLVVEPDAVYLVELGDERPSDAQVAPFPEVAPVPESLFMPPRDGVITGTIDSDSDLVRGGTIGLYYNSDERSAVAPYELQHSFDGDEFRVENLHRGDWELTAGDASSARKTSASVGEAPTSVTIGEQDYFAGHPRGGLAARVVGPEGDPVTGAIASLVYAPTPMPHHGLEWDRPVRRSATTDDAGRFGFSDLHPGEGDLYVWHPELGVATREVDVTQPPETALELTLQPDAEGTAWLRLVGESGDPIEEADLYMSPVSETWDGTNRRLVGGGDAETHELGHDGWVLIRSLEPGQRYLPQVRYGGLSVRGEPFTYDKPRELPSIEVPDAFLQVEHRTSRNADGRWVFDTHVDLRPADSAGDRQDAPDEVRTEFGSRIGPLRGGEWRLLGTRESSGDKGWTSVTVEPGKTRRIEVPLDGPVDAVVGRVVSARTGRPIPEAEVSTALDPGDLDRETRTDAAGRFRFEGLLPGDYEFHVHGFDDRDREAFPADFRYGGDRFLERRVTKTVPFDDSDTFDVGTITIRRR